MGERATSHDDQIATLRIELSESSPLIWRQLEVPTSITLKRLHEIIQAAMGWDDTHLWEFVVDGSHYAELLEEEYRDEPIVDALRVCLADLLGPSRTTMEYVYDFGDYWHARLVFTNGRHANPELGYPRYIGGELAAPPEDCGGIDGFYEKLAILTDPRHAEYEDVREWMGDFDPLVVDEEAIRFGLDRIARARRMERVRGKKMGDN